MRWRSAHRMMVIMPPLAKSNNSYPPAVTRCIKIRAWIHRARRKTLNTRVRHALICTWASRPQINKQQYPHQLLRDWSPVLNSCLPHTWLAEFTNHVTW